VLSGWDGASIGVRVHFTNSASADTFSILSSGPGAIATLGSVATKGDFVSATSDVVSTMVRSADGASVVITLGTPSSAQTNPVAAKNMVWTLGAGIADLAGNTITTPASWTETDNDVDF
jgi:hypothetical protein